MPYAMVLDLILQPIFSAFKSSPVIYSEFSIGDRVQTVENYSTFLIIGIGSIAGIEWREPELNDETRFHYSICYERRYMIKNDDATWKSHYIDSEIVPEDCIRHF